MHFAQIYSVRHRQALAFHSIATPSAEAANVLAAWREYDLRTALLARAEDKTALENDLQTGSALAAASGSPHRGQRDIVDDVIPGDARFGIRRPDRRSVPPLPS